MNIPDVDYRIWKNDIFIIESNISASLWHNDIINVFHKNLCNVLSEIDKKSDVNFSNSKRLISLFFSGDKKIIELNKTFRKIDSATNVLSFPSYSKTEKGLFLGDIIFSVETISREAKRDNKSINSHLIHLFLHGVLHLLGYDHETEEEAQKMENLEIDILRNLQIDNPYA